MAGRLLPPGFSAGVLYGPASSKTVAPAPGPSRGALPQFPPNQVAARSFLMRCLPLVPPAVLHLPLFLPRVPTAGVPPALHS